jgi:glycosyltransferase involved in cell wall biosynthesis
MPWTWKQVAKIPCDILHIQHWAAPMAGFLAAVARMARQQGKRVIITSHNPEPHESASLTGSLENTLYQQCDKIITHGERGARHLALRLSLPHDQIERIPHGVHPIDRPERGTAADYQRLKLDPARRYICIFGNLRGYKGIDNALLAWGKIAHLFPETDLAIAGRLWTGKTGIASRISATLLGTKHDAKRIQAHLCKPGLKRRIHLLEGFQSDANIDSILRISDLALFPYTKFNSQSGAACRAAGMGCPVLVSGAGELPDLAIDESWIATPGDTDSLAIQLKALLSQTGILADARQRQIQVIKDFSWQKVAGMHSALYRGLYSSGRNK